VCNRDRRATVKTDEASRSATTQQHSDERSLEAPGAAYVAAAMV
jgi:hypothetical protein